MTVAAVGLVGGRPAWHDRAACVGLSPASFFPPPGDLATQARAVCAACPVRAACLDYALATDQRHGVWGGLSAKQRRALRSRNRRRRMEAAFEALRAAAG